MHRVSHSVCGWVFRDRVQLVIEVQSVAGPSSHTTCFIGFAIMRFMPVALCIILDIINTELELLVRQ